MSHDMKEAAGRIRSLADALWAMERRDWASTFHIHAANIEKEKPALGAVQGAIDALKSWQRECAECFAKPGSPVLCGRCLLARAAQGLLQRGLDAAPEQVDHPAHYGGAYNPYEAIKVIEAWGLGFNLGNTVKYISRADVKGAPLVDLRKAAWYLQREIGRREASGG